MESRYRVDDFNSKTRSSVEAPEQAASRMPVIASQTGLEYRAKTRADRNAVAV